MLDRIIFLSFAVLFAIVPLIWAPLNFELFEYNKMMLTYGLTTVIVGAWLLKMVNRKSLIVNRTPLDVPLLLFLAANILSTIFSIDSHTSIWGYYSRSNGGLLSLISYLLLYWAFVSNVTKDQVFKLLKLALLSGFLVSIYAIPEHFGISPSCFILKYELNANCWVQDVQARVFATLGQPNWLAAYLAMLIFPSIYFLLTAKTQKGLTTFHLSLITLYMAFTFTYSRGATLGLITGMVVFLSFWLVQNPPKAFQERFWSRRKAPPQNDIKTKPLLLILGSFLLINLLFGSALTGAFRLVKQAAPPRPAVTSVISSGTQLETGGTESGQIRLIVWKGALDIFKNYPIFGSGVETFAYSYYQFRPVEHNLTSEWDFLYNKAHNEFLNYLATTGIVGFTTYMVVIMAFIFWCLKWVMSHHSLLITSLLASYVSYLIQNFFLFSVVIIAIFFYLFPALAFVHTGSLKPLKLPKKLYPIPYTLYPILYRRPIYTNAAKILILLATFYLLLTLLRFWRADTLFALGQHHSELGNPGRSYNYLSEALDLNKNEPFYRSELSYAAASSALALIEADATLSAELKDQAVFETEKVLTENPNNISFWRTSIRTFFALSALDPTFNQKTLDAASRVIQLAPTDPKAYYNQALILDQLGKTEEASRSLQKAVELKPNYQEAVEKLKGELGK